MRIAYVYDPVFPEIPGGVQMRIWEVAKRLARRGHDVHLFGVHCWDGPGTITRDDVKIHGVCPPFAMYRHGRRSFIEAIVFGIAVYIPLTWQKFDLIDCQHFPFFSAFTAKMSSILRRTPLVMTWHEVWGEYWYEYLGRAGSLGKAIELLVSRISTNNVAVSMLTAEAFRKMSGRECTVIPNGIDRDRILALPPAPDRSDVVFAGRLIPEKRVDLLIEAIALCKADMPDIRCVIIGDGPEGEQLRTLARARGVEDQVAFRGALVSHDEVIAIMKASRVFAFPSTREGFGIAALEALACGLVLVTADHQKNAAKDFVTAQQGILSALSPPVFAVAIKKALSSAEGMKPYALAFTESYDWEKITDLHEAYYLRILQ